MAKKSLTIGSSLTRLLDLDHRFLKQIAKILATEMTDCVIEDDEDHVECAMFLLGIAVVADERYRLLKLALEATPLKKGKPKVN